MMADERLNAKICDRYMAYRKSGWSHIKARDKTSDAFYVSVETVEEAVRSIKSLTTTKDKKKCYVKPPKLVIRMVQDEVIAYRRVLLDICGEEEEKIKSELAILEQWLKEVDG